MHRSSVFIGSVVLLVLWHCNSSAYAIYPPSSRSREGQLLDIMAPRILLEEFKYVPTREGYRYSYKLPDGTSREEVGILLNPDTPNEDLLIMDAYSHNDREPIMFERHATGLGPRMKKNRKLAPKALQSLAG